MKGKYVEIWENLRTKYNHLVIFSAALLGIVALLLFAVISLAVNRNTVIYIPSVAANIAIKAPSPELAVWWARHYVYLLTSFNPEVVSYNYSVVSSTATADCKKKLETEEEKIVKNKVNQTFIPVEGSWKVRQEGSYVLVKVSGFLSRYIGTDLVKAEKKNAVVKLLWQNGAYILEDWWYED